MYYDSQYYQQFYYNRVITRDSTVIGGSVCDLVTYGSDGDYTIHIFLFSRL